LVVPSLPRLSAYWDDGDNARGMLLFFDGNGYGAEAALRRLLIPARALGLDLVVFNYYEHGGDRPSVAAMRHVGDALFDAASSVATPAARSILVGGHSLGATFALMTAVDRPARGVFLVAPVTTGVAMLHHQLLYTRFIRLEPDSDYRAFDNLAIAGRVRTPTLVVGSTGDENLPPKFTDAVFAALPTVVEKRELILDGVPHSEYFAREELWRGVNDFFQVGAKGPFVGYLR
jgi:pimeloyl-ACP methyl ester carboxylesterase